MPLAHLMRSLGAAGLILAFAALPASAETTWKIQTLFDAGSVSFKAFQRFADNVKTMTAGELVIEPFPVGAVVPPPGTLDAIKGGVIDGQFSYAPIWAGRDPAFAILGDLSGGIQDPYALLGFHYNNDGLKFMQELYDPWNMHVVGVSSGGRESLPSRVPLTGVADLKGLKVRLPTGIAAKVFESFGAAPVTMPLSEAFSAMEKGVVDAADAGSLYYNNDVGMYQYAKHSVEPGFHSTTLLDFSVNKDKWAAADAATQRIVEIAWRENAYDFQRRIIDLDAQVQAKAEALGLTLHDWSDEDRQAYADAAAKVWAEFAGGSDLAREALDAQTAYLKLLGQMD